MESILSKIVWDYWIFYIYKAPKPNMMIIIIIIIIQTGKTVSEY